MRFAAILTLGLLTALGLAAATASAAPDACNKQVVGNHDTGVYTQDCGAYVSADSQDCLWGEHWVTYKVGPLTVRYTSCNSPYDDP
ncbi:MAG TPA: hypothetical protein VM286_05650 [Candidatus Thermoplasmatota archaeon]|nr:hypothetical protein [Candidatus Thermoplasmatota archaeon]